jgi:hypothetical protein
LEWFAAGLTVSGRSNTKCRCVSVDSKGAIPKISSVHEPVSRLGAASHARSLRISDARVLLDARLDRPRPHLINSSRPALAVRFATLRLAARCASLPLSKKPSGPQQGRFQGEDMTMAWTSPTLVEIYVGLEINGYLPAEY